MDLARSAGAEGEAPIVSQRGAHEETHHTILHASARIFLHQEKQGNFTQFYYPTRYEPQLHQLVVLQGIQPHNNTYS